MPTTPDRPADQLRAAVARALVRYDWNAGLSGRDTPSKHHYGEADAVLAVLPAPALVVARQLLGTTESEGAATDPAADRRARYAAAIRETDGWVLDDGQHMIDAVMAVADSEIAAAHAAPPAPADRAAVLREAADEIAGIDFHPNARARSLDIATGLAHRLRRLAGEAAAGAHRAEEADDGEEEFGEPVCVEECGACDVCGYEVFGTPAEGWREAARFLRRTARDGRDRGVLRGARLIEDELRHRAEARATDTALPASEETTR
ncbi:hypothetical protein AB0K57_04975 [Streptomyces halstedii]|uniref:hypothetical protein n=1 Tax=Streptomyces halstedii TaxID=1944 RepID=UPI00345F808C